MTQLITLTRPRTPRRLRRRPAARHQALLEPLETRQLLSAVLYVVPQGAPTGPEAFATLQDALAAAAPGDTIRLQPGFAPGDFSDPSFPTVAVAKSLTIEGDNAVVTLPFSLRIAADTANVTLRNLALTTTASQSLFLSPGASAATLDNVTIANLLLLENASHTTLTNVTVNGQTILSNSSNNTFTNSTLRGSVQLDNASDHNTIALSLVEARIRESRDTFAPGGLRLENNTLAGDVTLTHGTSPDVLVGNTIVGRVLLDGAHNATVTGNTFASSADGHWALEISAAQNVTVSNNQFDLTGDWAIAVYIHVDDFTPASATVSGNTLAAGPNGTGLYVGKWSALAGIDLLAQDNTFTGARGVVVYGDGASAGNVDFGGGSTALGSSTGNNNFTAWTSGDGNHHALALFGVAADYTLTAHDNLWAVPDPVAPASTVIIDGAHGGGSGTILAAASFQRETSAQGLNIEAVEGAALTAVVARFTDNLPNANPGLYHATIAWGDGTLSVGTVRMTAEGAFEVVGTNTYARTGSFAVTVHITAPDDVTLTTSSTTAVADAPLAVQGVTLAVNRSGQVKDAVVATFHDPGFAHAASAYVALINWGDGTAPSAGLVVATPTGFAVLGSHNYRNAGAYTITVSITTSDGGTATVDSHATVEQRKPEKPSKPGKAVIDKMTKLLKSLVANLFKKMR